MSVMRFDVEWAASPLIVDYLKSKIDAGIQDVSPVISFFDPMAVEEASRIIVEALQASTQSESPANFSGQCQVTIKSRWNKPTVQADFNAHYDRTNWVRDALMSATLADDLNTLATTAKGFRFDYIQPKRDFKTDVREGWIYSDITFRFNGYFYADESV